MLLFQELIKEEDLENTATIIRAMIASDFFVITVTRVTRVTFRG